MANEVLTASSLGGLPVTKVESRSPWLNLGIYGDSGVGKTVLAGSASVVEGMYPVLDIDLEGGSESLRRTYPNVEVVRVKNIAEMQEVYNELFLGKHKYRTVLLDSSTELQYFTMTGIMEEKIEMKPGADPDLPEWQQYGKNLVRMRKIIRAFKDLPVHTVFTSLAQSYKDDKTGITTVLPKHSGQFRLDYPALLDVILYMYMKEAPNADGQLVNGRYLLSQKTEKVTAKDRTEQLPIVMPEPTMQKLFDLMKKGLTMPTVPVNSEDSTAEDFGPVTDESMQQAVSDAMESTKDSVSESTTMNTDDSNLQLRI